MGVDDLGESVIRVDAQCLCDPQQFEHINPSLTGFVSRYEGLGFSKPGSQVNLADAQALADVRERLADDLVFLWRNPHDLMLRTNSGREVD